MNARLLRAALSAPHEASLGYRAKLQASPAQLQCHQRQMMVGVLQAAGHYQLSIRHAVDGLNAGVAQLIADARTPSAAHNGSLGAANGGLLAWQCEGYGRHKGAEVAFYGLSSTAVSRPLNAHERSLLAWQFFPSLAACNLRDNPLPYTGFELHLQHGPYIASPNFDWLSRGEKMGSCALLSTTSSLPALLENHQDSKRTPWGLGEGRAYLVELPYKTDPQKPTDPDPNPDGGAWPTPNYQQVYITMNIVNVFALPGGEPLCVADIRISCDRQTFSWQLSCEVRNKATLDLIKPSSAGYKELAVEINGHRFEFFIPKYSASRQITDNQLDQSWRITGYSRSQYLAEPYAPKRTLSLAHTSAAQAAQNELLGTDFTLEWDTALLPDWVMPNSSFSYQDMTPMAVIKKLAAVAGAIVQVDPHQNTVRVQPNYLVSAWELPSVDMQRTIHESQILSESMESENHPLFDAVVVAGETEGVLVHAVRQGTAGENPAPDITDSWLTAIEANTSRAKDVLCASGAHDQYSLELAIPESSAQPGLLLPGMTVAVVHDNPLSNYRAYVDSVSISVPGRANARVIQSISLDRPRGWEAAHE